MKIESQVLEKSDTNATLFVQYAPRTALAPFIKSISIIKRGSDAPELFQLPDGSTTLILRLRNLPAKSANGDFPNTNGVINLIGTRTHAVRKAPGSVPLAIAVKFNPGGAYPFFDVPLSEITDQIVCLEDIWQEESARLDDVLWAANDNDSRLTMLQDVLQRRLLRQDKYNSELLRTVRAAIRLIETSDEIPRTEDISKRLGVGSRRLRRLFDTLVGISPKKFARIARLQNVIRAAQQTAVLDWATMAADTGYYDQAHLISDFKRLTGITPGAFTEELNHRQLCS